MTIHAVIGAQFGDEGKGLLVDYLSTSNTLVVRFNGGAQAGHTVVTPLGERHEFHHIGAGTYRGADTLLSRFFLVNPILFIQESDQLLADASWINPRVYVDWTAPVTTPFDMLINRALENSRGDRRHGSCGLGIHETMFRQATRYALHVGHLEKPFVLIEQLRRIATEYVPERCHILGIPVITLKDDLIPNFMTYVDAFLRRIHICHDLEVLRSGKDIVFEGAQGLRLDAVYGTVPHVTHSRTGFTNIARLLHSMAKPLGDVEAVYVTRSYTTRHGAGPLHQECAGHPFGWRGPETNQTNDYQGALRYARLYHPDVMMAVQRDVALAEWPVHASIAVTCLDQVPADQIQDIIKPFGPQLKYMVSGPTRSDVILAAQPVTP